MGGWVGWLAGGVLRCLGWLPSTQLVSCYTTRERESFLFWGCLFGMSPTFSAGVVVCRRGGKANIFGGFFFYFTVGGFSEVLFWRKSQCGWLDVPQLAR